MVSTFLSYDLINRDMKVSLNRVGQQGMVERQTQYYKENIGKVASLDEFLDDYQLYSYAMEAHGLEEMTYAKAFMRQVLESDLNDDNSFANKLTDERYRNFAAAFNFSTSTVVLQTEAQLDKMIGLYSSTIEDLDATLTEETRYYTAKMGLVTNVDQVLSDSRMRSYIFKVFDIDEKYYSYSHVRGLMTSDVNDPNSYINQNYGAAYEDAVTKLALVGNVELHKEVTTRIDAIDVALGDATLTAERRTELEAERVVRVDQLAQLANVLPDPAIWDDQVAAINAERSKLNVIFRQYSSMSNLAELYSFANDGTATAGQAQAAADIKAVTSAYISMSPRATPAVAKINRDYFEGKINAITHIDELMADPLLVSYIRTAFDLTGPTVVNATVKNILTSDMSDPDNYIDRFSKGNPNYLALKNALNIQPDGTITPGGPVQTAEQMALTGNRYLTYYDDKDELADEKALLSYKDVISKVDTLDSFIQTKSVYDYALKAVGLDPMTTNKRTIRQVLTSDLLDPNSAVYKLKDDRYVKLAELFNFKADGSLAAPIIAQSTLDLQTMSAAYIKSKSVFGDASDREAADKEAEYYADQMQRIKTADELIENPRLVEFAMVALGLDYESVTTEDLKQMFSSDLEDPKSFINENYPVEYRRLVTAFNFDVEGNLMREDRGVVQTRRGLYETLDNYLRQKLEIQAGEENQGVRLALYFDRMASSITSYYTILADTAMQEFINTTFGIPDEMANANVDAQVTMMKRYFDLEDFRDPEKVSKLIARFTVMFDQEAGASDPVLELFGGGGGISADTLLTAAMLRSQR